LLRHRTHGAISFERRKMNTFDLQEQLQENLRTYLDGMSDELLDGICQVVVDTFHTALETKYSVPEGWTGTVIK